MKIQGPGIYKGLSRIAPASRIRPTKDQPKRKKDYYDTSSEKNTGRPSKWLPLAWK